MFRLFQQLLGSAQRCLGRSRNKLHLPSLFRFLRRLALFLKWTQKIPSFVRDARKTVLESDINNSISIYIHLYSP